MNIWVVGEQLDKRELWGALLTNSLLHAKVITHINENALPIKTSNEDIVFCLTVNFNEFVQSVIDRAIQSDIPILCIADNVNDITYDYLIKKGIKGLLNSRRASLSSIKDAVRIVQRGGYYIESPNQRNDSPNNQFASTSEYTRLDMEEWKVFSLASRGLTVDEISLQLKMSVEDITKHQVEIMKKTNGGKNSDNVTKGNFQGHFVPKK